MRDKIILSTGKVVEFMSDDNPDNPRDWGTLSKMICFHLNYAFGDSHNYNKNTYSNWKEIEIQICKDFDVAIIKPLYIYNHSGITIATTPFNCPWDSGQIGFVFATKSDIRQYYEVKNVTKKVLSKVSKDLEVEVDLYDTYLRGDVWGFKVTDSDDVDSCCGFYGSNILENGMLDNMGLTEVEKEELMHELN